MTAAQTVRGVLVVAEDAAAAAAQARRDARDVAWQIRDVDALLAEVDAGGALPDLVATADAAVVAALRQHEDACLVPVLALGGGAPLPPATDGALRDWDDGAAERVRALRRRTAGLGPSAELLDSRLREHRFARYLASRGRATAEDAAAFGVEAPRSLLGAWEERGWVRRQGEACVAREALVAAARAEVLAPADAAPPPAPPEPTAPEPAAAAEPSAPEPPAREPAPAAPVRPWRSALRLITGAGVLLLAFVLIETVAEWAAARGSAAPDSAAAATGATHGSDRATQVADGDAGAAPGPEAAAPEAVAPLRAVAVGRRIPLTSPLSARVVERVVAEGRAVRSGDALLRFDASAMTALLESMDARLTSLEETLAEADARARAARAEDLALAEEALEAARAEEARRRAAIAGREERYERARRLAEDGILAWREVRPEWDRLQDAREALAAAEEKRRRAARALAELRTTAAAPPSLEPAWQMLRAQLLEERRRLSARRETHVVRAPRDGVLDAWAVEAGEEASVGQRLATLVTEEPAGLALTVEAERWRRHWGGAAEVPVRRTGERGATARAPVQELRPLPDGTVAVRLGWPAAWSGDGRAGQRAWVELP